MVKGIIPFRRISYGTKPNRSLFLATIFDRVLIPDFEFEVCSRDEMEYHYSWKLVAMASFIKARVRKTGDYILNLVTQEIKKKPFIGTSHGRVPQRKRIDEESE